MEKWIWITLDNGFLGFYYPEWIWIIHGLSMDNTESHDRWILDNPSRTKVSKAIEIGEMSAHKPDYPLDIPQIRAREGRPSEHFRKAS